MKARHALIVAAMLGAGAFALSGCGGSSAAAGPCPKIGVLPDAADYPVQDASGKLLALARLSVSNSACIYDKSQASSTGFSRVDFSIEVTVTAVRAEGSLVDDIDVPVVVATVSGDGVLTARDDYEMNVEIDGRTGEETQRLQIRVPYAGNGFATDHRVLAAFRLDERTVQFNRSRLGR